MCEHIHTRTQARTQVIHWRGRLLDATAETNCLPKCDRMLVATAEIKKHPARHAVALKKTCFWTIQSFREEWEAHCLKVSVDFCIVQASPHAAQRVELEDKW